MTTVYKLTDVAIRTYNGYPYVVGQRHTFPGTGHLCGPGWSHGYTSPALALFLNPIHADFPADTLRLWRCEGTIGARDLGLKVGCSTLTLHTEIAVPKVTLEHRVTFALYCALTLPQPPVWVAWAEGWLSGDDRSAEAAATAEARAGARAWGAPGAAGQVAGEVAWGARAARAGARAGALGAGAAARAARAWGARAAEARAAEARAGATAREAARGGGLNLDAIASACLLPWEEVTP